MPTAEQRRPEAARVILHWLPLGAGGHSVRWNGRVFEALVARHQHRAVRDLYHSALEVHIGADRFVIEMTPVWGGEAADRGVVREGPVGSRSLRRLALFRYEVRCWRNGVIPDLEEAVGSGVRIGQARAGQARAGQDRAGQDRAGQDLAAARHLLELVPQVPALTWGRDELHTGEMWNSNSLIAWLLARSDHETDSIGPPMNGRAPGWGAGLVVAARQAAEAGGSRT